VNATLRLCAIVALSCGFAASAPAGEVVAGKIHSAVLDRDYPYTVYLPDGYETSKLRYPVLYLLHGANGNENEWAVKGHAQQTLDGLIATGAIPPMVVVMPGHYQGWWADGNAGKGESALLTEVMPHVESRYKVIAERRGRLIAGLSAGGYGTVNIVFAHPDRFAAAAALSPAIYHELPPGTSSATTNPPFQKDGKFDPETWKRLNWPNRFEGYKAAKTTVPIYLNSGDHDRFDIAYEAAYLYRKLREIQPKDTEFRVVDGDHEWKVWAETLPEALVFMAARVSRPVGAP
jgi:enterochelin esterase-like enzyme